MKRLGYSDDDQLARLVNADMSRKAEDRNAFSFAVSLGSVCLTAKSLEIEGLRRCKFPFDWVYSSPYMVRHALADNFKSFLDASQYTRAGRCDSPNTSVGHRLYSRMQLSSGRTCVWPHHPGMLKRSSADRASFSRAVQRFRHVLRQKRKRTLFVACEQVTTTEALKKIREKRKAVVAPIRRTLEVPDGPGPALGSESELRGLFHDLANKTSGRFHMDAVLLVAPPASRASSRPMIRKVSSCRAGRGSFAMYELHCVKSNTGLIFKDARDAEALKKLLTSKRRFAPSDVDTSRANGYSDTVRRGYSKKFRHCRSVYKARRTKLEKLATVTKPIRLSQENQKRKGSASHERYEKYKVARTVAEFVKLGGQPGDLIFDFRAGFLRYL